MKLSYIFILAVMLVGVVYAQYDAADSVMIRISLSSCPMMFVIDSLPHHPSMPPDSTQDTFFVNFIYMGHTDEFLLLDWESTYLIGSNDWSHEWGQAILVKDSGSVRLDFELATDAITMAGSPWWDPSDSTIIEADRYILRAIATGVGTPIIMWPDTVNFQSPESYYYVVNDIPKEITYIDTTMGIDPAVCRFYSHNLYGYDTIPTISDTGTALMDCRSNPLSYSAFFLHLTLTTPLEFGTVTPEREGYVILHITAKAMD